MNDTPLPLVVRAMIAVGLPATPGAASSVRHTRWLAAAAARCGASVPAPRAEAAPGATLLEVATHNAVEGCVHETWAALAAAHRAVHASDPTLRAIFDRISAEVTAKQREQEEFLELQIVLSMQEGEEKRVREDKARAEKRLRDRVEMMAANEHQKVTVVYCLVALATFVAMPLAF